MNAQSQGALDDRMSHETQVLPGLFSPVSMEQHDPECGNPAADMIDDQGESDDNTAGSSKAHSVYSPPKHPPMHVQQQPYFSSSKILDFDEPPMAQFLAPYDASFEMDLEFLSSIQA